MTMYVWLWHRLPGPLLLRVVIAVVLALAVVALLFLVVFPWVEPRLPFTQVTVDPTGGS
ncbi:MAG: hypothetical protein ACTHMZ_04295 [Actinomycetes bacterium]